VILFSRPVLILTPWVLRFSGFAHFCLGYPEQALAYVNAAIAEAQTEQHRPSIAQSLAIKARLLCFLGDAKILAECADLLSAIGIDQGFPYWRATGLIYRGWALVAVGDFENGAALIQRGSQLVKLLAQLLGYRSAANQARLSFGRSASLREKVNARSVTARCLGLGCSP